MNFKPYFSLVTGDKADNQKTLNGTKPYYFSNEAINEHGVSTWYPIQKVE